MWSQKPTNIEQKGKKKLNMDFKYKPINDLIGLGRKLKLKHEAKT